VLDPGPPVSRIAASPCLPRIQPLPRMITGYNTDVRHNEVVFHVQTEDKAPRTPSSRAWFTSAAGPGSKRASYAELLAEGKDDKAIITLMTISTGR